jgi:uncharacterized membrane protein
MVRPMLRMLAAVIAALGALAAGSPAAAEVTVCNKFRDAIYVAIGYRTASDFETRGWWAVKPGACRLIDERPVKMPYYIHAHTTRRNGVRYAWGKGTALAVSSDSFKYARANQIASRDRVEQFTKVSDGTDGKTKITYTILDAGSSMTQAR